MPAMDNEWVFSTAAAPKLAGVTDYTAGTRISENVHHLAMDSGNASVDLIDGLMPPRFMFTTIAAPTSAGSATLNIRLVSATDAALTAGVIVHYATGVLAYNGGEFDAGDSIEVNLDPNQTWKPYVGVQIVIADATIAAFTFTAALVDSIQSDVTKYATRFNFT